MSTLTTSRRILGCAAALAVALLGLTVWTVFEARRTALEQATVSSRNLAQTLQQHSLQAFQTVDLVLRDLADRLGDADLAEARAALPRHAEGLAQVRYLTLLDAAGARIADSSAGAPAVTPAERTVWTALGARADSGLFIGAPVRDDRTGAWTMPLARRLVDPRGRFAGVVIGALDLRWFQAFYDKVDVGPRGGIALFHTNGTLVMRKPLEDGDIGRSVAGSPAFRDQLQAQPTGTYDITSSLDGITRITSHHQLETYPFVIGAGLAREDVLAAWRSRGLIELAAAAALAVTVLCLGALLDREFHKRAVAEAEARAAAQRFERDKLILEAVLKALPDGIALVDADGRLQLSNDLLFEVLALDRGTILGAADPAAAFSSALTTRGDDALALDGVAAPPSNSVQEIRMSTGRWIERRVTGVAGLGHVAIYRDIANLKRRELEMQESQTRLQTQATTLAQLAEDLDLARQTAESARAEAETASRSKSTFIAGMNHELRTPLNAILGFAQVIHEQRFGPGSLDRYSEYASHIISSGEHLLSLINDLLDMAKIEAGKLELETQPIDIRQLLSATLVMVRETAASSGIAIRLEAPDEPIALPGDPRRLKQCFLNLVSNAIKFTPEGGRVVVRITPHPEAVEITVADTGIGVRPTDIAKIFEPFGQVDSPLARRHVGTGLGLPIARTLVELHGGDLSFSSVEGAGTTVTVSLPRQRLVA
jgi:signal transduction histidine kinase